MSLDKAKPKVDPETLVFASASVAARAISRGEITSTDLTKAILRRIEAYNPKLNAIVTLLSKGALIGAKEADRAAKTDARGQVE